MNSLNVSFNNIEGKATVTVCGEIDIHSQQQFKTKLNEIVMNLKDNLYVDCTELNYIDSTGLGILVGALKEVKKDNNNIYISNLKDNIRKLFNITGLDKLFIIE